MTGRESAPPLEMEWPACSVCGGETTPEDGHWECAPCDVTWPITIDGQLGEWANPDAEQCPSIGETTHNPPIRFRCILTAGHEDTHHRTGATWPQPWVREVHPGEAAS